jgi:hypothetical protein
MKQITKTLFNELKNDYDLKLTKELIDLCAICYRQTSAQQAEEIQKYIKKTTEWKISEKN